MQRFQSVLISFAVSAMLVLSAPPSYAKSKPLPKACTTQCKTPFGEVLGMGSGGVPAYSNCKASCVYRVPDIKSGTYTGIKWQCVEYARRWLLINKGVVYGDVNIAADIWGLKYVTRVKDKRKLSILSYPNGSSTRPVVGDLLIYAKAYLNTGHVAVISAVDKNTHTLRVQEQNFENRKWPGDYARSIPYIKRGGHYWVLNAYLLGWKHITNRPFTAVPK